MPALSRAYGKAAAVAVALLVLAGVLAEAQNFSCYSSIHLFNCPGGKMFFRGCSVTEDPSASAGLLLHWEFKTPNGTIIPEAEGFDPCLYATCYGITCNKAGYYMTQGANVTTVKTPPLQFLPLNDSSLMATGRCACGTDTTTPPIVNASIGYTVNVTGPSTTQNDIACQGLVCSQDSSVADLYFVHSSTGLREDCECCQKDTSKFYVKWTASGVNSPTCGDLTPQLPISSSSEASSSYTVESSASGVTRTTRTPESVVPSLTMAEFISNVCPAGTMTDSLSSVLTANEGAFCCYQFDATTSALKGYTCGEQNIALTGDSQLTCVSSITNHTFSCCANMTSAGTITSTGSVCGTSLTVVTNGAASLASSALPALLVAVAAVAALLV